MPKAAQVLATWRARTNPRQSFVERRHLGLRVCAVGFGEKALLFAHSLLAGVIVSAQLKTIKRAVG